ncbi:PepSY-associated TM helix domain-containing protein [Campylobacter sp. CX2-8023-23]|uniref:PepSY-associated TM helix domain-containing protein n=1 Tax=Campylobacter porcelli TaxID=1660073 RepID=UPI002EA39859|nr:PepSY-associated TM helix domain-containing protein [Campylobacter sp. CX2-8023-23]
MLLKKKKWIFNIHLIVAMILVIPLFIICISGAMLSYDKPIAKAINAIITPNSNKILNPDFADLTSKFKAQNPSLDISSISYEANSRYYTISTSQNSKNISYLVNDDGIILSSDNGTKFMRTIRSLHRWLLFSEFDSTTIGRQIVAISTIGFIILTLSGIYLYLPALKNNFIKALTISFKSKKLMLAYKSHTALGVIFGIIFLTMNFTGLFWPYDSVKKVFAWAYGVEIQQRPKGGNKTAIIENRFNSDELKTALIAIMPNFTNFDSISISQSKPKHYTFNIKKANEQRVVTIDIDNPNLLTQTDASQNKNLARKVLDLHSGRAFGYLGEFVFCVASFIGGVIAILGFIITYARIKPKSAKNKI